MNDPLRVRFSGPLAAHADGLRAELESRGYTPGSAALQLQVAAQLSRWMQASGFGLGDLADAACVGEVFAQRRVRGLKCHISPKAVPMPAQWRLASLPDPIGPNALAALLASCDRDTPAGRRDRAVLVVLSRLGLRAAEAAALQLSDVGWRDGTLRVRGKGSRTDVLPLPADAGSAIADYVRGGRPPVAGGPLFHRICAPPAGLSPTGVTSIVYRACERAGLPRAGAHRLRHAAATAMLGGGASLPH